MEIARLEIDPHESVVDAQNLISSVAHGLGRPLPAAVYRRDTAFFLLGIFSKRQNQPSADHVWNHFSTCAARSATAIGERRKRGFDRGVQCFASMQRG